MVDVIVFVVAALMCLGGALGVVLLRNPVHAALSLVLTLFGVAVHFVSQEAHFLAAVQVIVYAGAIVVLFLFVIMLLGVDKAEKIAFDSLKGQTEVAVVFGVGSLAVLAAFVIGSDAPITGAADAANAVSDELPNVTQLAYMIFSYDVYAFELTSVMLVIAVIAAVVLARRPSRDDEEADL